MRITKRRFMSSVGKGPCGLVITWKNRLSSKRREFLYIPAGMPHLPANLSTTEQCVAVLARTDPNEQESVTLLPELDALVDFETA